MYSRVFKSSYFTCKAEGKAYSRLKTKTRRHSFFKVTFNLSNITFKNIPARNLLPNINHTDAA